MRVLSAEQLVQYIREYGPQHVGAMRKRQRIGSRLMHATPGNQQEQARALREAERAIGIAVCRRALYVDRDLILRLVGDAEERRPAIRSLLVQFE